MLPASFNPFQGNVYELLLAPSLCHLDIMREHDDKLAHTQTQIHHTHTHTCHDKLHVQVLFANQTVLLDAKYPMLFATQNSQHGDALL